MSHDDFAVEPVPGLPERPPEGEHILWQGRPDAWALSRDALAIRPIAGYFVLLAIWRATVVAEFGSTSDVVMAVAWMAGLGAIACGLLYLAALIQARSTLYTITNRRVAMRIGAALTVTLNLPFRQVMNAGLSQRRDGTGTIAMTISDKAKLSYLVCWPHVRPWRINPTEPALRSIPDAARVAGILAEAAQTRIAEPQIERAPDMAAVAAE